VTKQGAIRMLLENAEAVVVHRKRHQRYDGFIPSIQFSLRSGTEGDKERLNQARLSGVISTDDQIAPLMEDRLFGSLLVLREKIDTFESEVLHMISSADFEQAALILDHACDYRSECEMSLQVGPFSAGELSPQVVYPAFEK